MSNISPTGIAPVLQVHPTRRCNLVCDHCYSIFASRQLGESPLEILSALILGDAFDLGYRQLAVSGGEPLLYAHLPELLARGRDLGMLNTVTTNGMLIRPDRWRRLAPLIDILAVSIDGREAEHDQIRRRERGLSQKLSQISRFVGNQAYPLALSLRSRNSTQTALSSSFGWPRKPGREVSKSTRLPSTGEQDSPC